MAPTALGSGRSLRAAWERQQRAAQLAAAVARTPQLARFKPAFFAAQLQPVLTALWRAAEVEGDAEEAKAATAELQQGPAEDQQQEGHAGRLGSSTQRQLAAAASHLRRLAGVDRQAGANASLLLWLLLGLATRDKEERLQGAYLASLCAALGWHALLLEALPLLLLTAKPAEQALLADLAGTAAAEAANSSDALLQRGAHRVATSLARCTQRQLEEHGSSSDSSAQQALLQLMAAMQQLLLAAPIVAAAPDAASALQQLQAAADSSMAGLMQSMQAPGEQQAVQQAVFQQLCQLRARLMLAFAAAAPAAAGELGTAAYNAAAADTAGVAATAALQVVRDSQHTTAQAWRSVLLMPPDVPAAAAAAAARAHVDSSSAMHPNRQQFLAAWVAATSFLLASSSTSWGSCDTEGTSSTCGSSSIMPAQSQPAYRVEISALPGVRFLPPSVPAALVASCSNAATAFEAAAEAAATEVTHDPDCLGPVHLTLAALQLAQQVAAAAQASAGSAAVAAAAAAWPLLLELAASAAAMAADSRQQRQLLLLLLHGQQAWLCRLREALAADAELQRSCRRELVAVANRLASEPGARAPGAPAVVHGEERRRRTAAAVAALLPHALLCPAAVLERLVKEAVVQSGEQVGLLLDVLREMAPLAGYRPRAAEPPLLLTLLAQLLLPSEPGASPAAVLDTPGSRDALLQLVAGLCGCQPAGHGRLPAPAAVEAVAAGQQPLLSPAAVLEHVVSPALRLQQQAGEAADPGQLLLPLQLAQLLAGSLAAPAAGNAPQQEQLQRAAQHLALLRLRLENLLDLGGRRVDRSAAALQASPEMFELAAAILQQTGATGSAAAAEAAVRYFQQEVQHAGRPEEGQQPQQPTAQQRQRMLLLLASLLPCLTAAEAAAVLQKALPGAVQELLLPPAARQQAGRAILPGAHAAAVEAACRAVLALALQPGLAPILGEQANTDVACAGSAPGQPTAAGASAGGAPSALRAVAVERALQHIVQYCVNLASARAGLAASGPAAQSGLQLRSAEAQALGLRCTRELCQLAAALDRAGYDCSTAQVGLLQLVRQLLAPPASQAQLEAAGSLVASAQQGQQQLLARAQVQQQLEATAASLPEGRPRDVLLLGIQQACAE